MRKVVCTMFFLAFFPFIVCAQPPETQVLGAWKAKEKDPELGKTHTFVITEKTLDQGDGSPDPITLTPKDNKVVVQKAGTGRVMAIINLVDKDTMVYAVPLSGDDVTFIRTTEADVQEIRAAEKKK